VFESVKLYTYPGDIPYGALGGVIGTQETYSWRTGKVLESIEQGRGDLTGEEMYRAILTGHDIDISPTVSGLDRIIDKHGSTPFGGTDYSSFDNGHNFYTVKTVRNHVYDRYRGVGWPVKATIGDPSIDGWTLDWWGYPPTVDALPFSVPPALSESERNLFGNRLFKSASPTRPYSQTIRGIGEFLKDGIPLLFLRSLDEVVSSGVNTSKGLSQEYLNAQFGILPIIKDIRKICEAVINSRKIVEQYASQSGNYSRRERSFADPRISEVSTAPLSGITWNAAYGSPSGPQYNLTQFLQNSLSGMQRNGVAVFDRTHSFAGAFTYALPDGTDVLDRFNRYAAEAHHVLGLQLSADVLYDLVPFTWLLDWIVDFGTVLDNSVALGTDHLVSQYAYHMTQDEFNVSTTVTGVKDRKGNALPAFVADDTTLTRKYRDRATPYGFGINVSEISQFQWSILAALGLSRGRNIKLAEPL
jgi:hypothetical protein